MNLKSIDVHELAFENVSKSFADERAVADVTLRVESGERVAVIGPSGAGKTTFLRLASGAVRPDEGTVTFDGEPLDGDDVALAYQGETLVGRRTALANVLSGHLGSLPWWRGLLEPIAPNDPSPALELLDAVGLGGKATARADSLSAGERQRVAFARALIQDAVAVLADEPTANLDPSTQTTVLDVLDRTVGDRILVIVLHDVGLARDRFDRLVGMADGRVRFDEPVENVTDEMLGALFDGETDVSDADATERPPTERGPNREVNPDTEPEWYA